MESNIKLLCVALLIASVTNGWTMGDSVNEKEVYRASAGFRARQIVISDDEDEWANSAARHASTSSSTSSSSSQGALKKTRI